MMSDVEVRDRTFRLPDMSVTTNLDHYVNEWTTLQDRVGRILGLEPQGCDPVLTFYTKSVRFPLCIITPEVAQRLIALAEKAGEF